MLPFAPNKRLLLRRGDSFSAATVGINVAGPGHIGAFGTGDLPSVETTQIVFRISGGEPEFSDWRISDIFVSGASSEAVDSQVVSVAGKARDLLLLRVHADTIGGGVSAAPSLIQYLINNGQPDHDIIDGLTLQDCDFKTLIGGQGHNFGFIGARRFLFLGNSLFDSTGGEHVLRTPWLDRAVLSHNHMGKAPSPRHVIKLHGPEFDKEGIEKGQYTEKIVLSDNRFEGDGGHDWTVAIGPKNAGADERIRNVLVERNSFLPGTASNTLLLWGSDITVRSNVFLRGEQRGCISTGQRGVEPPPERVHVYNNTAYSESDKGPSLFSVQSEVSSAIAKNNLVVSPFASDGAVVSGGAVEAGKVVEGNNLLTSEPGFMVLPPQSAGDVSLKDGSPAIDAGVSAPVWADFFDQPRPSGSALDIGAVEAQ